MQIAKRLRELREDRDYTQEQVAEMLGIQQTVYSRYENEKNELPIHHLHSLCLLYKVSADYIIGLPKGLKHPER